MAEWTSVLVEGDSVLVTRTLARLAARVGISWCVPAIEDSTVDVRSARHGEFVSSGAMAIVSDCAQFIAAVITPEASASPDIATCWQASEPSWAAGAPAGQWLGVAQSVPQRGAMNIARMVSVAIAAGTLFGSACFMPKVNATLNGGAASNYELGWVAGGVPVVAVQESNLNPHP
jgi:hypothetical protein